MPSSFSNHLFQSSLLLVILLFTCSFIHPTQQAIENPQQQAKSTNFIRTSCSATTYPKLCITSLSSHANLIQTNRKVLTDMALNVTLSSAKSTSAFMYSIAKSRGLKPREVSAMKDCVEELSDAVDELRKSIGEMGQLKISNFEITMSDLQTWVSAALTEENTCTEGFQGNAVNGNVKTVVRGRIVNVGQLTSNALALINQLASNHY
ncbi:21 kDa protein [Quillaja saponaria]|uniref:21 kDa protein n=1 Tax=Quillaja saponaria TaxID=32244 RepID=A0AAD7L2D1_QUISA|nr:21 kDa protein [Quillaja saponaria]